ncbi:hypothetical protein [Leptolyngbya iicbica]|uniref:Uncharacterized protein n=2 Tax=Cyanophyceae TaxID=3028117 RepID=A0A4V2E2K2_9CYAN|nr:hypothetical protein [Leptolyngbya sp. LK]RZM78846.1 hypothetical protein DYY88_08630 [Leptolyngbya sp. LK]
MWQSAINYFRSLRTYRDLSPDAGLRRRINVQLSRRPSLTLEDWSSLFSNVADGEVSNRLFAFIYAQLPVYSGLEVSQIRPGDRLIEDLQLPLVCWFDWPNQLCCDFYETFHIDISEEFDESLLETVGDLVWFLHQQLESQDSIASG